MSQSPADAARATMQAINDAWRAGKLDDLAGHLHPQIAMALPGFADIVAGAENVMRGFEDFVHNATLHEFSIRDEHVHAVDATAVVSFAFEGVYEREGNSYTFSGRDLWVFTKTDAGWKATWRTLLDPQEQPR